VLDVRIIRFHDRDGQIVVGKDLGNGQAERLSGYPFDRQPIGAVAEDWPAPESILTTGEMCSIPDQRLSPLDPCNIFCIGLNYAEHAREGGSEPPEKPVVFMKPTSTVSNPGDPIRIPASQLSGPETDYECELAVIIGKAARDVSEDDALNHVFGYTCANDVSARNWQRNGGGGQWIKGKGFDSFCPLGPTIVTSDEITDPQSLTIRTILNGQVMQESHTSDMIFSVRVLISFLSRDMTLLPGTVILTGTPSGVGFARKPPVWLAAGDQVTIEVEKVGQLSNPVLAAE